MSKTRRKVYIAGPLSKGNLMYNIRDAVNHGMLLWKAGYAVYIPHLTAFADLIWPMEYKDWLSFDDEWLLCCDAMLRIPGESPGADKEERLAAVYDIPVYYTIHELQEGMPP